MNPLRDTSKNEIIGELFKHGFTIPGFADHIGCKNISVKMTIYRYAGKKRLPKGMITKYILSKLGPFAVPKKRRKSQ